MARGRWAREKHADLQDNGKCRECTKECVEFVLGRWRCSQKSNAPHSFRLLRKRSGRPRCCPVILIWPGML
jgi:hypothetical protein